MTAKSIFIWSFPLFFTFASAQLVETPPVSSDSVKTGLSITGFSYPIFLNGEEHSSFAVEYRFNSKLAAELQGFYDTYLHANRIRGNVRLKYYLTKKLFVFGGPEVEGDQNKYIGLQVQPPRIGLIMGVGYEVDKNFMLEAGSNLQINNSPMGAYGEPLINMPSVWTLGGKVKF
ncbi:hypothetical protein [Maribacter sp. 2210JD10-5]|uniref:hypothetical protein n=1 Tax=Maribacter sp. 2210JD10-5 TaxID=3386272 RepID=UPI0039BD628C